MSCLLHCGQAGQKFGLCTFLDWFLALLWTHSRTSFLDLRSSKTLPFPLSSTVQGLQPHSNLGLHIKLQKACCLSQLSCAKLRDLVTTSRFFCKNILKRRAGACVHRMFWEARIPSTSQAGTCLSRRWFASLHRSTLLSKSTQTARFKKSLQGMHQIK